MVFNDEKYSSDKKVLMQAISKALDLEHSQQLRGAFLTYLRCISECCRLLSRQGVPCGDRDQLFSLCRHCLERVEAIDGGSGPEDDDVTHKCGDVIIPSAPPALLLDGYIAAVPETPTGHFSSTGSEPLSNPSASTVTTTTAVSNTYKDTVDTSPSADESKELCKKEDGDSTEEESGSDLVPNTDSDQYVSIEDNRLNNCLDPSPPDTPADPTDSKIGSDWEVLQPEHTTEVQCDDSCLKYSSDSPGLYADLDRQLRSVDTTFCSGDDDVGCSDIAHPLIAVENPEDCMRSYDPLEEGQTECERLMKHFSTRVRNSPGHQHHQLRLELQRRLAEVRVSASRQHETWLAEKQRSRHQYLQHADRLLARCPPVSPSLVEPCRSTVAEMLQFESEHSWAQQLRHQLQRHLAGGEENWRALHSHLLHILMEKSHPMSRLRQRLQFSLYSRLRPLVEQHGHLLSQAEQHVNLLSQAERVEEDSQEQQQREEAFRRHLRNIVSDVQEGVLLLSAVLLAVIPGLSSLRAVVASVSRRVLCAPLWPHLLVLYRLVNLRCESHLAAALLHRRSHLAEEVPDQAKTLLRQMLTVTCPEQKCVLLVRLVKSLCSPSLSAPLPPANIVGADELLPRLTALVVWSRSCQLPSELQYIGDFLAEQAFRGECGYCFTSMHTAVMCLMQQ